MENTRGKISPLRIETHYAAVQGSYQLCNCAIGGFTAVYLAFKGFSDTQIGLTVSLVYLLSVTIQLTVADYSDAHIATPIKHIICMLYMAGMAAAAAANFLPLPITAMMIVFALAQSFSSATDCFISAMMMQFVNLGVPVRYGWPRSVGSITYALLALVLGEAIETHSPDMVMILYIALAAFGIVIALFMPRPDSEAIRRYQEEAGKNGKISYRRMLSGNRTLVLLIVAVCVYSAGSAPSYMFMIRIIERLGGNSGTLGKALFVQAVMELPLLCLSPLLVKKFPRRTLMCISIFIRVVRIVGLMLAPSLGVFFLVTAIGGANNGIYMFASVEYANSIVRDGERVRSQSLLGFSGTLGSVISNGLAGVLLDALGLDAMLGIGAFTCLTGFGIMLLCSASHKKQFDDV